MDRLSALTFVVALVACDSGKSDPLPSRVNGAKVGASQQVSTDAFCDVHFTGDQGPKLAFPEVTPQALPDSSGWRWLNVWATWCKPCVEELPRLARWQSKLKTAGHPFELQFVSIDESDDDIGAFKKAHADAPIAGTVRLKDLAKQSAWFKDLGLDGNPPIPIHVFVAPSGHIRCARAGGIREQDYAAVERLLGE
jgi:thiol-disulfide isomerase/thioredoxin